jgi:hypothetical protein
MDRQPCVKTFRVQYKANDLQQLQEHLLAQNATSFEYVANFNKFYL